MLSHTMKHIAANHVVALAFAAVLAGCSSLSEKECLTADWESVGYRDGSRGYDAGRVADHGEACAEVDVKPDRAQYEAGRVRGLEFFCTGSNGVRIGRQGGSYAGVCPADLEPGFLRGYDIGRNLNDYDQHMSRLRTNIEAISRELRREEPPLGDKERDSLLYQLRTLEREFGRMQAEANQLEREARQF